MASRDQESTPSEGDKSQQLATQKQTEDAPQPTASAATVPEKHPLQNKWVLWYLKNDKTREWTDNLKQIISFDTVEDFWGVFNHVRPPSQIPNGCDYMLFKNGIRPMWEDRTNKEGGRWLLILKKKEGLLDNSWTETLMCLVGEVFDDSSDEVCGAVVQTRQKGDKLCIWTRDFRATDHNQRIGQIYKDKLAINIRGDFQLVYQAHRELANRSGSYTKNLLTV